MCGDVSPDACFNDVCTGEDTASVATFTSKAQEWESIVANYTPTGDDALDYYNRERALEGKAPVTAEQFTRPLRAATDMELADTKVRTRYAQPGQRTGNGYVRVVSSRQVSLIKRLMIERNTTALVRLPGSEDIERMSLAGARDLIERLLACPELPATTPKKCSLKQWEWLRRLTDKDVSGPAFDVRALALSETDYESSRVSGRDASMALDVLFNAPSLPAAALPAAEALIPGIYRHPASGDLIKAYLTRTSGQLVGATWVLFDEPVPTKRGLKYGEFEYGGKRALSGLSLADRLSLDEAKALGAEFHYCCACGIELTNPESIAEGIGPICARKLF